MARNARIFTLEDHKKIYVFQSSLKESEISPCRTSIVIPKDLRPRILNDYDSSTVTDLNPQLIQN